MLNVQCSAPSRLINTAIPAKYTALMPRHRLFIPQAIAQNQNVEIEGERAHYLKRVLRMKAGSELVLFTGDGYDYPAEVTAARKDRLVLRVGEGVRNDNESPLDIRLVQGISRGERMDFAVQKATELGVQRITPVFTEFSVVKLNPERAERRMQHWQKIVQGACEQCGRNRIPPVDAPVTLKEYFAESSAADRRIAFVPGAAATLDDLAEPLRTVDLLVGPEGGFSKREIEDAAHAGFFRASLGPRILRSETAALTAVTMVQSKWGDI